MTDGRLRIIGEVARALRGDVSRGGDAVWEPAAGSSPLGASGRASEGRLSTMGTWKGRPVQLELRNGDEIEIDLAVAGDVRFRVLRNGFLARLGAVFGRRMRTGDPAFDDDYLVMEEGGAPLDGLVARPGFPDAIRALDPFEHVAGKGRILEAVLVRDAEAMRTEELLALLDALSRLADLME